MTDEELNEIEAACANASPGPWMPAPDVDGDGDLIVRGEDHKCIVEALGNWPSPARTDIRFIASARSWVPELVAEVKRLRAALGLIVEINAGKSSAGTVMAAIAAIENGMK